MSSSLEALQKLDTLISGFKDDPTMLRYINQNLLMPRIREANDSRFSSFVHLYSICDIAFVKFENSWYPCLIDSFSLADENGNVRSHGKEDLPRSTVWAYYYYGSASEYDSYKVDLLTLGKVVHIRPLKGESKEDALIRIKACVESIVESYPNHKAPYDSNVFFDIVLNYIPEA